MDLTEHIEVWRNEQARPICKGTCLYDGIKPMPVQIFAINFDFYYELDEGYHEDNQVQELNAGENNM
jgi:hypothetical protein